MLRLNEGNYSLFDFCLMKEHARYRFCLSIIYFIAFIPDYNQIAVGNCGKILRFNFKQCDIAVALFL